jgi:hypothetical protein
MIVRASNNVPLGDVDLGDGPFGDGSRLQHRRAGVWRNPSPCDVFAGPGLCIREVP